MKWGLTRKTNDQDYSVDSFHKEIDRVFNDFFSFEPSAFFKSDWLPKVDVREDEKEINVTAELPGIDEKDLNVSLEQGMLTISGEKKSEREERDKKKNYVISERHYGSFSRSIALPEGVKADKIKAEFKKGILKIEIPKDETVQPKKITINVN